MTEVERVAEAMYLSGFVSKEGRADAREAWKRDERGTQFYAIKTNLLIAARYHLAALRRARGKTVGYCGTDAGKPFVGSLTDSYGPATGTMVYRTKIEALARYEAVARVVLDPKKRRLR